MTTAARRIARVIPADDVVEGAGFLVHRPLPVRGVPQLDPFLLIDELGPTDLAPGEAVGAPDHPHRGFETVSYVIEGGGRHADSRGHRGAMGPGDVQWMTAGSGVVHSELPDPQILARGGRVHGFQLWINLPKAAKMIAPRYQEIPRERIARVEREGLIVRVIAGVVAGARGPVATHTPVTLAHATIAPGATLQVDAPRAHTALAYVFGGVADAGDHAVERGTLLVYGDDADAFELGATGPGPAEVLLLIGAPIGEPMARYGPFVMNTIEEVQAAFDDFAAGRMGSIDPEVVAP